MDVSQTGRYAGGVQGAGLDHVVISRVRRSLELCERCLGWIYTDEGSMYMNRSQ